MNDLRDWIDTIAGLATATGVVVAAWQLYFSKSQNITSFEDTLAAEYRALCQKLPIEALLCQPIDEHILEQHLREFFHYFTLTNDQIFMRKKGRVRYPTWSEWADGIAQNMAAPAFKAAWDQISERDGQSFSELRTFLSMGPSSDPKRW